MLAEGQCPTRIKDSWSFWTGSRPWAPTWRATEQRVLSSPVGLMGSHPLQHGCTFLRFATRTVQEMPPARRQPLLEDARKVSALLA